MVEIFAAKTDKELEIGKGLLVKYEDSLDFDFLFSKKI
jgi:hypothetical protein